MSRALQVRPTHLSTSHREVGKDAVFLVLVSRVGFEALHVKREGGGEDVDRVRCTVEPLNKGHYGANNFVLCR